MGASVPTIGPPYLQGAVRDTAMLIRYREALIEQAERMASMSFLTGIRAAEVDRKEDEFAPFGSEFNGCVLAVEEVE